MKIPGVRPAGAVTSPSPCLDGCLDDTLQLVDLLSNGRAAASEDARLAELDAAFQAHSEAWPGRTGNGNRLPPGREELLDAVEGIRGVFQLLLTYAAWRRALPSRRSFQPLLDAERRLLERARQFARDCWDNRPHCPEVLRGERAELEAIRRIRLQGIVSLSDEGQNAPLALRLLELFDELASADAELMDCLQEVYAATRPW
mgnify:CR=1 FL=1